MNAQPTTTAVPVVRDKNGKIRCRHNRVRCVCKECGGSLICRHLQRRDRCDKCGGSEICKHGRQRSSCKEHECGSYEVWARQLLRGARKRARDKGLSCGLDTKWVAEQLSKGCPIFEVPFDPTGTITGNPFAASVDRFYADQGYTKENSFVISFLGNTIKNKATTEQVIAVAEWMKQIEAQKELERRKQ